jgi:cytochrome c peroxidase
MRILLFIGLFTVLQSCKKDSIEECTTTENRPSLPSSYFNYENIILPSHYTTNSFPARFQFQYAAILSDNTPSDNPITNEGATLGRVLFYDKKLSANTTISCSSCHKQEHGFSDPDVLSKGFGGGHTRRHSMGLTNARFYGTGKFFWDERAATLEDQVLMPFQDAVEMGLTLPQLEQIVKSQSYYPSLFNAAFGNDSITSDKISKSLAQFVRSMVSINSKYDVGRAMTSSPLNNFPNFTAGENNGKSLFNAQNLIAPSCNSCHLSEAFIAPLLTGGATTIGTNNGLDSVSNTDAGIYESTGINGHRGKFKVPSLRNIGVRPPYMHDGRFASLAEVLDHYSTGIQNHPTLQPFLKNSAGNAIKYNFTSQEKTDIIAFLHTLTDNQMLTDEKYSDPF